MEPLGVQDGDKNKKRQQQQQQQQQRQQQQRLSYDPLPFDSSRNKKEITGPSETQ